MCTLSIIPVYRSRRDGARAVGFRLVFSRDEQRSRPAALPPRWHEVRAEEGGSGVGGKVRAIWPTDAQAGGTWIAGTTTGVVVCLLNAAPDPMPRLPEASRMLSRGGIIPAVLSRVCVAEVGRVADEIIRAVGAMDLERYAPFRLVALEPLGANVIANGESASGAHWGRSHRRGLVAAWHRDGALRVQEMADGPVCLASSGLGDARVLGRIDLFGNEVVRAGATPASQDRFHRHAWANSPETSVLMSRADARTVSITTVEVVPDAASDAGGAGRHGTGWTVEMEYVPVRESTAAAANAREAEPRAQRAREARTGAAVLRRAPLE
jgi:hypothetical protein